MMLSGLGTPGAGGRDERDREGLWLPPDTGTTAPGCGFCPADRLCAFQGSGTASNTQSHSGPEVVEYLRALNATAFSAWRCEAAWLGGPRLLMRRQTELPG